MGRKYPKFEKYINFKSHFIYSEDVGDFEKTFKYKMTSTCPFACGCAGEE